MLEVSDGKIVKVVTEQPKSMSDDNWHLLSKLQFGIVVFANPSNPLAKTMPEQMANGDLERDWYFICWNFDILKNIDHNYLRHSKSEWPPLTSGRLAQGVRDIVGNDALDFIPYQQLPKNKK